MIYDHKYVWGNNQVRAGWRNKKCAVLAHGRMNSIMVEFEDGRKEIVSRYSVRKIKD